MEDERRHPAADVDEGEAGDEREFTQQAIRHLTDEDDDINDANLAEGDTCPDCGDGTVIKDEVAGELRCEECQVIFTDGTIDHGPEWRAFDANEASNRSRTGPPQTELLHDKGIAATISNANRDSHGNTLSGRQSAKMNRLRRLNRHAQKSPSERGLSYGIAEVKRMGAGLGAPKSIQETAATIFRTAQDEDLLPGRSIEAVASAALYIAFRIHNSARSVDEVVDVSRVGEKSIHRARQYLLRELDLTVQPASANDHIPRFATYLNLPDAIKRRAESLIETVEGTHHISGNDPTVLAAAAIYAASLIEGSLITQRELQAETDVTEVSIRNNYGLFLTVPDDVPVNEIDLENASSPLQVASLINDEDDIEYLSKRRDSASGTDSSGGGNGGSSRAGTSGEQLVDALDGHGPFICQKCNDKPEFKTLGPLVDHATSAHGITNSHKFSNSILGDSFPPINTLYPDAAFDFACPVCPYIGSSYHSLKIHFGRAHKLFDPGFDERRAFAVLPSPEHPITPSPTVGYAIFTCEHCDDSAEHPHFLSLDDLHEHQDIEHTGERNTDDTTLQTIDALHTPRKLFVCPECEAAFANTGLLLIHGNEAGHELPDRLFRYQQPQHIHDIVNSIIDTLGIDTPSVDRLPTDVTEYTDTPLLNVGVYVYTDTLRLKSNPSPVIASLAAAAAIITTDPSIDDTDTPERPAYATVLASAARTAIEFAQPALPPTATDTLEVQDFRFTSITTPGTLDESLANIYRTQLEEFSSQESER